MITGFIRHPLSKISRGHVITIFLPKKTAVIKNSSDLWPPFREWKKCLLALESLQNHRGRVPFFANQNSEPNVINKKSLLPNIYSTLETQFP